MATLAFMLFNAICTGIEIADESEFGREKLHAKAVAPHGGGDIDAVTRSRKCDELELTSQATLPLEAVARLLFALNPSVVFRPARGALRPLDDAVQHLPRTRVLPLSDASNRQMRSGGNTSRWTRFWKRPTVRVIVRKPRKTLRERLQFWLTRMKKTRRSVRIIIFFTLLECLHLATRLLARRPRPMEFPYSQFLEMIASPAENTGISNMVISPRIISFRYGGAAAFTRPVLASWDLIKLLSSTGIPFMAAPIKQNPLALIFPIAWLAILLRMSSNLPGAPGSKNVGKRASSFLLSENGVNFADVAGVDVAKSEVQEIVSMLRMPGQYKAAGARLPSGVLMVGPPGTGKTLLARAMASQAGVPFFYCSGSDFVEIFVGRGAARMRELFKEAGKKTPCLIFIDELDVLGKQRSIRMGGSNDEIEQTLNQMLACMDGLDSSNNGIIVMGATNRYEVLDPALTRPGRFDRVVRIGLPDREGRVEILRVHTRNLQLDADVDLPKVADATPAYSGAELAALANEAAIRAVRRGALYVNLSDFLAAVDAFNQSRLRLPRVDSLIPEWMRDKNK